MEWKQSTYVHAVFYRFLGICTFVWNVNGKCKLLFITAGYVQGVSHWNVSFKMI